MVELAQTALHYTYANDSLCNNPDGSAATSYAQARDNFIAYEETPVLFAGNSTQKLNGITENIQGIYSDNPGNPAGCSC